MAGPGRKTLLRPDELLLSPEPGSHHHRRGVAKARTLLFQPLQEIMKTQLAAPLVEYLEILPAQFGTEAGILGAAHLALNTHFGETFRA